MSAPTGTFETMAKMNLKKMGANGMVAVKREKHTFLARIYGEAQGVVTKEAQSGNVYNIIVGEFRAETHDGKKFFAERLELPKSIAEKLEAQVKNESPKAVLFGLDIFAAPNDKSSVGYEYSSKPVIKTATSDRLGEMTAALADTNPLPLNDVPSAAPVAEVKKK